MANITENELSDAGRRDSTLRKVLDELRLTRQESEKQNTLLGMTHKETVLRDKYDRELQKKQAGFADISDRRQVADYWNKIIHDFLSQVERPSQNVQDADIFVITAAVAIQLMLMPFKFSAFIYNRSQRLALKKEKQNLSSNANARIKLLEQGIDPDAPPPDNSQRPSPNSRRGFFRRFQR